MTNVKNIEVNMPHVNHEVICVKCLRRYWACVPTKVLLKNYQCGGCGETGYMILTGQPVSGEFQ